MNSLDSHDVKLLSPELTSFLNDAKSIPIPFCYNLMKVKAFVLGADPSNFSIEGKTTKVLTTVFGIGEGDARYFSGILTNLSEVGLSLEDIYVQNLVRNYLIFETSKNHAVWLQFAKVWVQRLKEEFDSVDNSRKTPVLVTAEVIFRFLNPEMVKCRAMEIYTFEGQYLIRQLLNSKENRLGRPVIPFYRHLNYRLCKEEFKGYKEFIKSVLVKNRTTK